MSNLRRALRLLELLTQAPDGARLTDLAQSLGVNRAIPHRALSELIEMGYVRQDPDTERYLATFKLGALGLQQLEVAGLGRWTNEAPSRSRRQNQGARAHGRYDRWRTALGSQGPRLEFDADPRPGQRSRAHAPCDRDRQGLAFDSAGGRGSA